MRTSASLKKVHLRRKMENIIKTCGYSNGSMIFEIPNETRDPCIKIIVANQHIFNGEVSTLVCNSPKLITLVKFKMKKKNQFNANVVAL